MDNKLKFKHFLIDTSKLSINSINRYIAVVETISGEITEYINNDFDLYELTDFIQVKKIIEKINLSDKFVLKNTKGQKMYSSGLKWYLEYLKVNKIIDFISWNDRNGVYKVKERILHEFPCLSYKEVVMIFFSILNDDIYYKEADNILELSWEDVMKVAKKNNIYEQTMKALEKLLESQEKSDKFYRTLI